MTSDSAETGAREVHPDPASKADTGCERDSAGEAASDGKDTDTCWWQASRPASAAARTSDSDPSTSAHSDDRSYKRADDGSAAPEKRVVELMIAAGRFPEAFDALARLERTHGKSASVEIMRGNLYLATGNFCEAAATFMAVLLTDDSNVHALKAIAQLHHRAGNLEGSLQYLRKALKLTPKDGDIEAACAQVLVELGTDDTHRGQLRAASQRYAEALQVCDEHAGALYHMGVLTFEQGRPTDACQFYRRCVKACPWHVQAWTNLGVLQRQGGELDDALRCFQQALQLAPNNPVIRSNMAILYVEMGARANERAGAAPSSAFYERALAYDPQNCDALYNLGVMATAQCSWERAIFYYETCLRSSPTHAVAWNNLGVVYQNVDNVERSIQCYECAIELRPDFHQCLNNLGVIYTTQGMFSRASTLLRAAIAARPDYAEAHNNLGVLYRDCGLTAEAIESYEACMRLCPESSNAFQNRLLALNYITPGEEASVSQAHAEWGRAFQALIEPLPAPCRAAWRKPGEGKLRVGYMSPDFYTHSVSYFSQAALLHHNRADVELFVYCCTPRPDHKTAFLKTEAVRLGATWRSILGVSDEDAAALIRADRVDVLVELTGHTAHNRLGVMRYRPAPVQMTWIGYPNSDGLEAVDYRITDAVADPEDTEQQYVETLLRLDGCFLCYSPMVPYQPVSAPPCLANGYVTFGSFNALAKITDQVVETWSRVLHAVPDSRLVLKNKPFACAKAQALWLERFRRHGIDCWRLDLLPLTAGTDAHMAQYSLMDVSLDPWPYAGTTTTCESLFMGVPCITLAGKCHAHNVGVSLLTCLDLHDDWVARDRDEYVAIAVRAASQPEELAAMRRELRERMLASPLCDAPRFMQRLERAYADCFERWSAEPQAA